MVICEIGINMNGEIVQFSVHPCIIKITCFVIRTPTVKPKNLMNYNLLSFFIVVILEFLVLLFTEYLQNT